MATTRTSAAKKPAAKKPAAKKPAAKKPAAKKPAAKKPAAKKPAAKKPAAKKPAAKKPAARKPAARKPAAKKPAAKKPAARKPAQKTGLQELRAVEMYPVPPREVYACYVEAHRHEQYTGGKCISEARVGGRFVAYDDYIRGKYLELEPGHRIVQEWSTTDWPPGAAPSRLELILEPKGTGTELTMIHTGVPAAQAKSLKQGWQDFYWVPLRMYLEQNKK